MPYTDVQIVNMGLGKIGAGSINNISPATTKLERRANENYDHWRDSELSKHPWAFAREVVALTLVANLGSGYYQPYKFSLPTDFMFPIRGNTTTWVLRGEHIYSANSTEILEYIARKPASKFPALFAEVLACRVGIENVESAIQSTSKDDKIEDKYKRAVHDARKANAFIVGPQSIGSEDTSWIEARHGDEVV